MPTRTLLDHEKICLVTLADETIWRAAQFVKSHSLKPANDADIAMVCFYLTIIENSKSCVVLRGLYSRHWEAWP